jgi:putative hydrolase of the HAD superfamily
VSGAERVVFWDFDGTLAFRDGLWSSTLAKALELVAPELALTAADLREEIAVGFPWHAPDVARVTQSAAEWWAAQRPLFLGAYASAGVGRDAADAAIARIPREYYRPSAWILAHDAIPALRMTADAGYRNAILSNHAPELPGLVADLGLGAWIDTTVTSAVVGAEKPDPRIFQHAMLLTDAGEDVWMVGDNPRADIAGAEALGIRAIQVGNGRGLLHAAERIADRAPRS